MRVVQVTRPIEADADTDVLVTEQIAPFRR